MFLWKDCVEEAAVASRMAGRPGLVHKGQQAVQVAVRRQASYFLEMTGSLPLQPKALPAAAVVMHQPGLQGLVERFFIHM